MRKNKKLIMVLAIVLAVATAAAGATFAWFTANDQVINHMETDQFSNRDVRIAEIFDPTDPFNPGVDINKDVWVVNTSDTNALVRVSFAESLLLLANNGNAIKANAGWTPATTGTTTMPQMMSANAFNAGGYYNGWNDLSATPLPAPFSTSGTIPTDVVVLWDDTVIGTPPNEKTKFEFVAYHVINAPGTSYDGKYQTVDFKSVQNGNDIIFSDFGYLQFEQSATAAQGRWAQLNSFLPPAVTGTTFTDLTLYPLASPLRQNADFVANTVLSPGLRADSVADPNHYIELAFTPNVKTDLSTCVKGDWWYNQADGYFYYIGSVDSGQTSEKILDAVGMKQAATSAYCLAEFDLLVCMEAVQNVKEVLSSNAAGGWNLDVTTGNGLALLTLLESAGVNAFVQA